jgi:hypothetical protein
VLDLELLPEEPPRELLPDEPILLELPDEYEELLLDTDDELLPLL